MKQITDNTNIQKQGIKRRNFFMLLAASVAGIFAIKKFPFKYLQSKVNGNNKISFTENPLAVKRDSVNKKRRVNG